MIQPPLINLHPNEYSQGLRYYIFVVKFIDTCVESCNTLNGLSNKGCVPNKAEDLNIHVSNMITGKNQSKRFKRGISCKCKCKFDEKKCNWNEKWNNVDASVKRHYLCEKYYIWNLATCSCKNRKCLPSIIDDSVITFDEIIEAEC